MRQLSLSKFNYGNVVYPPCLLQTNTQGIQKLQKSCLYIIYEVGRKQRIFYKLQDAGLLNTTNCRYYHIDKFFYKIIMTDKPPYLSSKIRYRIDDHDLSMRFRGLLLPYKHRMQMFKLSFSYVIKVSLSNLNFALHSLSFVFVLNFILQFC